MGWSATPLMGAKAPSRLAYISQLAAAIAERQAALGQTQGITRVRRRQVATVADLQAAATAAGQRFLCQADGHCYQITALGPPVTYVDKGLNGLNGGFIADSVAVTGSPAAGDVAASATTFASMQNWIASNCGNFLKLTYDPTAQNFVNPPNWGYTLSTLRAEAGLPGSDFTRVRYRNRSDAGAVAGSLAVDAGSVGGTSGFPLDTLWQFNGSSWVNIGRHCVAPNGEADKLTFYGRAQIGDIVGYWLYNELQACLNKLVLTFAHCSPVVGGASSAGHNMSTIDDAYYGHYAWYARLNSGNWPSAWGATFADACTNVEALWDSLGNVGYADRGGSYASASYGVSQPLGGGYQANISEWGMAGRLTKPSAYSASVKWYELPQLYVAHSGAIAFAPEAGARTYVQDRWNLVRTDAANSNQFTVGDVPGRPDIRINRPTAINSADNPRGRNINGLLAICDWRVAGGFTYY